MLDLTLHNQRTKRKATEKEIYFEELFDLDEPDCSSGGVNDILNELEASRPSKPLFSSSQNKRRPSHIPRPLRHLGRTVSAPINGTSPLRATSTEVLHEVQESRTKRAGLSVSIDSINHQARQPSTPDKGSKKSSEPFKMSIAAGRKRKRGKSLDVLPEAQQIFKGLRFCMLCLEQPGKETILTSGQISYQTTTLLQRGSFGSGRLWREVSPGSSNGTRVLPMSSLTST